MSLKHKYGAWNDILLMNKLQDRGLISDEAITIEDCADRDLMRAWQEDCK